MNAFETWLTDFSKKNKRPPKHSECFEAGQKVILNRLREVAETGILPDGDHVNLPTKMWLETLVEAKDE